MDRIVEACGKVAGEGGHLLVNRIGRFKGVGAGQLEDGDRDCRITIEPAAHLLIFRSQFHTTEITKPNDA